MNWQPIATAPRETPDGVLGWVPSFYQGRGGVVTMCRFADGWWMQSACRVEPSHWMPLPGPPRLADTTPEGQS